MTLTGDIPSGDYDEEDAACNPSHFSTAALVLLGALGVLLLGASAAPWPVSPLVRAMGLLAGISALRAAVEGVRA